jgi:phosphatidylglycerophosphatase A
MFGLGKIKYIPGTIGSLATVLILYFCFHVFHIDSNLILLGILIIFIYSFVAVTNHTKNSEIIGQSIPIFLYEVSHGTAKESDEAMIFYGVCFILFRYFDIVKPFPVSYFDKKHKNSFGVIMDDVCAGFYVVLSLICFMVLKGYIL